MVLKFDNFINEEKNYYIFDRAFRIDDLIISNIYKNSDIYNWTKKYDFDRWAIGIFVTENSLDIDSPINRIEDRTPTKSEFGNLLDKDNIQDISKELNKKIDIEDSSLRISGRDIKNKRFFSDTSKDKKGLLIEESKIEYEGVFIYLYIFNKGRNDRLRARQLNGIVYESRLKRSLNLKEAKKGQKWDAYGKIDLNFLENVSGEVLFNAKELNNDFSEIPDTFLRDYNWSIKSCSNSSSSIYFADFKRISGLDFTNGELIKIDNELEDFMLIVGFHTGGKFTHEYIIKVNIVKWLKYIPDVNDPETMEELSNMYNELSKHRIVNGIKNDETESNWNNFRNKYGELTKDKPLKLNFKRDTKGQLRIQCSMSIANFEKYILEENNYILIKDRI